MKGLLWIACVLLGLATVDQIDRDPMPLAIEATPASDLCDTLRSRPPLPKHRLNPMVNGLDKPNGEVA